MKWEIVLPNRKSVFIDDNKKIKIEEAMNKKTGMVEIDGQWFDVKSIRGIFQAEDKKQNLELSINDERISRINDDFNAECSLWATKTPEEKAVREMRSRIVPFWKLEGGKREDKLMRKVYDLVVEWFGSNASYPRCPVWVWGSLVIKETHKQKLNHLINIIQRNDAAIENWIKYYGVKKM